MPIKVTCKSCQSSFNAPDNAAGKKTKCPKCQNILEIPTLPPAVEEPVQAEVASEWGFDDEDFDVEPPLATEASTSPQKACPMCGEMIAEQAVKCRYCKEIFDPVLRKNAKKGSSDGGSLTTGEWFLAILCPGIGCILGIIWLIQGKPNGGKMVGFSILFSILWNIISTIIQLAAEAS